MAQDQDNTVTLINFSWVTYHTTLPRMICVKYSSVMVELLNCACTVNQTTDAKALKAETTLRECLIMDLSRSKINKL